MDTSSSDLLLPIFERSDDGAVPSTFRGKDDSPRKNKLTFATVLISLSFFIAASLFFGLANRPQEEEAVVPEEQVVLPTVPVEPVVVPVQEEPAKFSEWVLGAPTERFRDNIRNDTKYMTTWIAGGWTNDVMSLFNILYVSTLTERVAVMPPFMPSHLPQEAGAIDFGQVFDVPRLSAAMKHPVVEWWQIKDRHSTQLEDIGCWSVWATSNPEEHRPREVHVPAQLKLDVSYTAVPRDAKLIPESSGDWHTTHWGLAAITFPQYRKDHLEGKVAEWASPEHKHTLLPDDHMVCYDFPYFMGSAHTFEFNYDYSPGWRYVGKYARWNGDLQDLANQYLRRAFSVSPEDEVPPFISLHVRRGDFGGWCRGVPREECFAPLSAYARRVREVQEELRAEKGIEARHVLMTSDEEDPTWWDEVKGLGWTRIDHAVELTNEKHGLWYTPLLDAVFQTAGIGFVGTDQSTMTLMAQRRVEDWHGGVTRVVKWGHKDADAH